MATDAVSRLEAEKSLAELEEELSDNNIIHKARAVAMAYTEPEPMNIISNRGSYFSHCFNGSDDLRRGFEDLDIRLELVDQLPAKLQVSYDDREVLEAHTPREVRDLSEVSPQTKREVPDWKELLVTSPKEEELDLYLPEISYIVGIYRPNQWLEEVNELYNHARQTVPETEIEEIEQSYELRSRLNR